jgi:very-short-patch-repair endonuclease
MDANIHKLAKNLRIKHTDEENLFWSQLRARRLNGLKFRRQQPIGNYIVDFICFTKKIVIEVDGGQHSWKKKRNEIRDKWLSKEGYKLLRFWNNEVFKNLDGVLEIINQNCVNHPPLTPPIDGGGKIIRTPINGGEKRRRHKG